jgi:eukaryotic-like serine/threonine-protein kinase
VLEPGSRLGPYEILSALGAGGMGEVYRARDTKLNRDVAIKVLPELVASDPDRLARFEREAQTLAALNHPNIAQVHGVIEGPAALVMELVEGEDLAARRAGGPVPMDEALAVARQIAEALEAAHERGIVHRDLKPANIKVRPDGTVKVLDFGLAKAVSGVGPSAADPALSPTITSPAQLTAMGVIIGTAAYMAPEQARGKAVDRRADIWAFGCVLFEMLTGTRAFPGDNVTDMLAAIVRAEPDFSILPADTPPAIRRLLRRCLEKDPRRRLQAIGEARLVLEDPGTGELVAPEHRRSRGSTVLLVAALVIAAAGIGALGAWMLTRTPPRTIAAAHLALPIAPAESLAGGFALSPDGSRLVFVGSVGGRNQIFLRRMDREAASVLPGSDGAGSVAPAFSPDGTWVVFSALGSLKKVPAEGGPVTVLTASASAAATRPAWGPDDTIVFSNSSLGLSRISAAGGQPEVLTTPDLNASELAHEMPWLLPDGKTLLFGIRRSTASTNRGAITIVAQSLQTGQRRELFPGMVLGFVGDNELIVGREGTVQSLPFDPERLVATGQATTLLTSLPLTQRIAFSPVPLLTVARNGTMVFQPARPGENDSSLAIVDRTGGATPIPLPPHLFSDPRVSPDGERIVVHVFEEGRDNWVADLRRGTFMRLTFDTGEDETPVWSPDGRFIFWTSTRANVNRGIYRKSADGSGQEQLIWSGNAHVHIGAITPDGETLVISMSEGQQTHLHAISVTDGRLTPVLTTPFTTHEPSLSPDGRLLAYSSNESGIEEVYVQPFPSMEGRAQVSAGGGSQPVWSRTGTELFYRGRGKLMAVEFTTGALRPSPPNPLFDDVFDSTQGGGHTSYDVTPDGRFVMIAKPTVTERPPTHLTILYRP